MLQKQHESILPCLLDIYWSCISWRRVLLVFILNAGKRFTSLFVLKTLGCVLNIHLGAIIVRHSPLFRSQQPQRQILRARSLPSVLSTKYNRTKFNRLQRTACSDADAFNAIVNLFRRTFILSTLYFSVLSNFVITF